MNKHQLKLIEFLNDQYKCILEYVNENDDYINGYDYYLEQTIDLEKARTYLDCDNIDDDTLKDIILDNYTIERASHYYPDNALTYVNIDEIEDQVSGISNDETNCIFSDITRYLTDTEIKEATKNLDFTLNGDCIYFISDFRSIQLVVDYDIIQSQINEIAKIKLA